MAHRRDAQNDEQYDCPESEGSRQSGSTICQQDRSGRGTLALSHCVAGRPLVMSSSSAIAEAVKTESDRASVAEQALGNRIADMLGEICQRREPVRHPVWISDDERR